jgi:hypothetical protein
LQDSSDFNDNVYYNQGIRSSKRKLTDPKSDLLCNFLQKLSERQIGKRPVKDLAPAPVEVS